MVRFILRMKMSLTFADIRNPRKVTSNVKKMVLMATEKKTVLA